MIHRTFCKRWWNILPAVFTLLVALLPAAQQANAQMFDPVDWSFSKEALGDGEYALHFDVEIEEGWYVYSQHIGGTEDDIRPIPTTFTYDSLAGVTVEGEVTEHSEHVKEGPDEMFEGIFVKKFSDQARFTQRVKLDGGEGFVKGYLEFMTCNDERCLPPKYVDFEFTIEATASGQKTEETTPDDATSAEAAPETEAPTPDESNNSVPGGGNQGFFDPVDWAIASEKTGEKEYDLKITATIDDGWYIYAQKLGLEEGEAGPVATTFTFDSLSALSMSEGDLQEVSDHVKEGMDPVFEMQVKKFSKEVTWVKTVKAENEDAFVRGYLQFMTCNDERCLPPTYIDFEWQPVKAEGWIETEPGKETTQVKDTTGSATTYGKFGTPIANCGRTDGGGDEESKGMLTIFFLGFVGGLLALLTPCVFPMIPLTVSFFTKGSEDRKKGVMKAFLYSFCIVLIYFLFASPFLIFDIPSDILNSISTNPVLNVIFFAVFMFFAFSFFGYYELTLPHSVANKVDNASNIGGIIGIFFMALTLGIVSFSCTGPILGTLLVGAISAQGGQLNLVVGMVGFGLALALPFGLFAAFPSFLNKLPKSGGWLDTFKKILGFLEVGLALKFLSNADLVEQWGFIKREIFLGIWIVVSLGLAAYLLGLIRLPHDVPIKKRSAWRWGLSGLSVVFAIYLATGLFGNNLKMLSGFPPPMWYSLFPPETEVEFYHDYEEALAAAKAENKPILIDFTGYACVNCRKVEETVWVDKRVQNLFANEFIIASLYVDAREELPKEEQYVSEFSGNKIRTVGNKWSDFQAKHFNSNSQPQYIIVSPEEKALSYAIAYQEAKDADDYVAYLQCGLSKHKSSLANN